MHGLCCSDKVCAGARQAGVLCLGVLVLDIALIAQGALQLILALILRNDLHKVRREHLYQDVPCLCVLPSVVAGLMASTF